MLPRTLPAGFITPPFGRFLDIGCGTGALSFLLLARDLAASGVGVEIQPRLAALAERGRASNGFEARFEIRQGDVRAQSALGRFDLIATNPPYRPLGKGVLSPDSERSVANHEVSLTLDGWLDVAAAGLAPEGRLCVIFPAGRLAELRAGLKQRKLAATRLRLVAARAGETPGRVLVEARRGGALTIEPPLVVHAEGGFTPEVRGMVGDEDLRPVPSGS